MIVAARELMPVIRAALERGQRVRITANGSSMLPFIRDGDVVELEPVHSLPTLGDVVLVRCAEERYVLHRVVRVEGDAFFLCGDAQQHRQGPFTGFDAVGQVTTVYRGRHTYALGRGIWRIAGRVWARSNPLNFYLLQLALPLWQLYRRAQRRLVS